MARILAVIVAVLVLGALPAHSLVVTALASDPLSPTVVYAGSYSGGVLKSADGGQNWSPSGLTSLWVTSLAIDPRAPSTLYAGTSRGGIFKTDDGGELERDQLRLLQRERFKRGWLAIDPQTPTTRISISSHEMYSTDLRPAIFGGS